MAGYNPLNFVSPIFSEIDYAAYGKAFNDATYGGTVNIYKTANLEIKSRSRTDIIGRNYVDMYDATVDIEYYANKIKTLYTKFLLSAMGPQNLRFKLPNGEYCNFIDNGTNGNGVTTYPGATGSVLLNDTFTFEVDGKNRSIKSKYTGGMYRGERQWQMATGTASTGGSSGAAITGIAHLAYDITEYAVPGITGVTVDGVAFNALHESSKLSLDFKEMGKTFTREQPILGFVDSKIEIATWGSNLAEQIAAEAWAMADHTINFTLADGMVISYVNSLLPVVDYKNTDKDVIQIVSFNSHLPIDRPAWGGTIIAFNVGANTLTLTRTAYA